ncbi:MAG TPA: nitroreductase family protein [Pyrinomonadaceae bacterium]|nr:nitroreductase family protein [Pyrinomonadaceae bacterium]
MQDKPTNLPTTQAGGETLRSFTEAVVERRASNTFKSEEVPEETLNAILQLGLQAPSGYNLQPWRFIVVREQENRARLQAAAYNQAKVGQAPVVVIAVGMKEEWKRTADEVFQEGARRGAGSPETVEQYKQGALSFLSHMPMDVWVNRHTMIAFTTLMYAAEVYGYDTAPMEGFDAAAIKREFGLPEEAEVVALLAIGRAEQPDKAYPGRFPLERVVYSERFGEAWKSNE